jgi:ketosteroid isomerase-like protein
MTPPEETAADDVGRANLEVVRRHYKAFARRDIEGVVADLDSRITITTRDEHGKSAGQGIQGLEGARAFFEDIYASVAHPTVEIERLRADGDKVLAHVRLGGTVRDSGATGSISAVHLFTIFDGRIREIRTHRPRWRELAEG